MLILSLNRLKVILMILLILCGDTLYCKADDINTINDSTSGDTINSSLIPKEPNITISGKTELIIDSLVTKSGIVDYFDEHSPDPANDILVAKNRIPSLFDSFVKRLTTAVVISSLVIISIFVVIIILLFGLKVHKKVGFRIEIKRETTPYEEIQIPDFDLEPDGKHRAIRQMMTAHEISYDEAAVLLSRSKQGDVNVKA